MLTIAWAGAAERSTAATARRRPLRMPLETRAVGETYANAPAGERAARPEVMTASRPHAPRRRRRQHPDPLRDLRRHDAGRALALRHGARVDGRRARRPAVRAARAARDEVRQPRGLDR